MGKFGSVDGKLRCSFCAKQQPQVKKLSAGPRVYFGDECIALGS